MWIKSNPQFLMPLAGKSNAKKAAAKAAHTTKVTLNNSQGANDLVDVQFVYVRYGETKVRTIQLASKVKIGKKTSVTLEGENPAAFFILWKLGNTYDSMGDGNVGAYVYDSIDATWGHQDLAGIDAQVFGYQAGASAP